MTTQLSPLAIQHFTDNNGNLLAGGQLYTYAAGTSTPLATYTDSTGGTPNTNPVIMNARGEANVWTTGGLSYKFVLEDASGVTIWTVDNITDGSLNSALAAALASTSNLAQGVALVGGASRVVASIAVLRTLPKTGAQWAIVADYSTAGNAGGMLFRYDSTDTTSADDGVTIIVASDGGRWKLSTDSALTVKMAGAQGDGSTDDSAPLQTAFSNTLTVGWKIPAGQYKFATGLIQDNSGSSPAFPGPGVRSPRNSIKGESLSNSILNYSGAGYAITLTGSTTSGAGQGIRALENYQNFTIQDNAMAQSNSGMSFANKAWFKVEDVLFNALNVGLNLTACFSAKISTSIFSGCAIGAYIAANALGSPNAVTFSECLFEGCTTSGVEGASVGSSVNFRSCNFESCGTQGNNATGGFLGNLGAAGFSGPIVFDTCYFEQNRGANDINIDNTLSTPLTVLIRGCIFQRTDSANYTINNIGVTSSGGGIVTVLLEGNSFISAGSYVPNAARLFWVGGSSIVRFVDNGGNSWNETTSLPANFASGRSVATAQFFGASGSAPFAEGCSVVRNSVGNYTVTFTNALPSVNYAPIITMDRGGNGAMGYTLVNQAVGSFNFTCTNQAASLTDPAQVWVAVFN